MTVIETRIDIDELFGLSRPTVQTLADRGIQADLKFLDFQNTGQPPSSFTAKESDHLRETVSTYIKDHPLGFLAKTSPYIAGAMGHDALHRDITRRLDAYNSSSGNFADAGRQIAELRRQSTDAVITSVPRILDTIHRNGMVNTAKSMRKMADLADGSLWGTSNKGEREMRDYFRGAARDLDEAVRLMDSGDTQAANTRLESVLGESHGYTQWFNRSLRASERQKFTARLGITVVAGAAASLTGGISLGLMGYGATASAAEISMGALAGSMVAGGFGFTATNRLLSAAILKEPVLHRHGALENILDLTQETLSVAGAMGTLRLYGILGAALPTAGGEFASVLNFGKTLGLDFAGLTHWEMIGAANPDAPDLQRVFSRDQMAERMAMILGMRAGGAALRSTPAIARFGISGLRDFGREVLPQLAPYPLMLASRINFKPIAMWLDRNLQRTPIILIGAFNVNMSYALSLGLRYLSSRYFPNLAEALPMLFSAGTDLSFFNPENLWTTWWRTNAFGLGVLIPIFAGYPGSLSRRISNVKLDSKDFPFKDMTRGQIARTYANEFKWRGLQGISKLLGFQLEQRKGRAAGFGLDLVANAMGDATYAAMFRTGKSFPELVIPSFIISALVGYANTVISQHPQFNHVQQFSRRTVLGIGKSGVYRGFCATDSLSLGLNMFLQVGYGVMAIWYALNATRGTGAPETPPVDSGDPAMAKPAVAFTAHSLSSGTLQVAHADVVAKSITDAMRRGNLRVLVTDSGTGGVPVAADIYERLLKGPFNKAKVLFVSAQPTEGRGYNNVATMAGRAEMFDRFLSAAETRFHPDLWVIACNTLSIVYRSTNFFKQRRPVVDIADTSVRLMHEALASHPGSQIIIFGTPTTISSLAYQRALMARGIEPNRITAQACPDLAGAIETNLNSEATRTLVNQFVDSAVSSLTNKAAPVVVSLNCTHYGFAQDLMRDALARHGITPLDVLDPSYTMMSGVFDFPRDINAYPAVPRDIRIRMVTQVPIGSPPPLAHLVRPISAATAEAMGQSTLLNMFTWADILNPPDRGPDQ